jgi:transcriptional regulator with XRE-family HTH domain
MITALRQRTRGYALSRTVRKARYGGGISGRPREGSAAMVLLRHLLGDALRRLRLRQGRTLREVSAAARVSLGYLSEVERGQKEASSELLASICGALGAPMSQLLREVSDNFALAELQNEPVFAGVPALAPDEAGMPAQAGAPAERKVTLKGGTRFAVTAGQASFEQVEPVAHHISDIQDMVPV